MANCTTESLVSDSRCLVDGMNERQLLAAILCVLATANNMECDATTLIADSRCLEMAMSERQLLAAIALVLCEGGGGGGGGNFRAGSGAPSGATPGALRTAYSDDDTGVIYVQNADGTWPTLP